MHSRVKTGDIVGIKNSDPTTYFRFGSAHIPTANELGIVDGSALVTILGKERLAISVHWEDGARGTYLASALDLLS